MPRPPLAVLVRTVAVDAAPDADLLARFRRGDATAFEALARRHGGRVWAACRGVLGDTPDAEDAFQAAFVVLARDPGAVRKGQAVGSWLYGVAHRIALKARARRTRRTHIEARAMPPAEVQPPDLSWREACAILHEELDRLPDKYRYPLMLCYLEGLPRDEAAKALGSSLNVMKGRLERGREALRQRLTRRGVTLSAGLLSAVAANQKADAGPSVFGIAENIARPSPAVAALAASRSTPPVWFRLAGLGLAASVLVGIVLGLPRSPQAEPPKKEPPGPAAKVEPKAERIAFAGTVVDPKGKPVAGAKVYLLRYHEQHDTPPVDTTIKATSDSSGRFRFDVAAADYPTNFVGGWWYRYAALVAAADGFALGLTPATVAGATDAQITMAEDVPLGGRVISQEGKPVPGATVRVLDVSAPKDGLKGLLKAAEESGWYDAESDTFRQLAPRVGRLKNGLPLTDTKSDADGRFVLRGVGRDRMMTIEVAGPGIAIARLTLFTDTGASGSFGSLGANHPKKHSYYRPPFDYVVSPVQPFEGRVTDRDTGRPIPNLTVRSHNGWQSSMVVVSTRTDADGRYKLVGLDPGEHSILVDSGPDDPYFHHTTLAGREGSVSPVGVDVALKRAVWLSGRLTDVRSGAAAAGVTLEFAAASGNTAEKEYLGAEVYAYATAKSGLDGRFRLRAVPGRGWVVADNPSARYVPAFERDVQGDATDRTAPASLQLDRRNFLTTSASAVAAINVRPDGPNDLALTVDPGVTVSVRPVDPDGKPLPGVRVHGAGGPRVWTDPLDVVAIRAFNPDRPRPITLLHSARRLATVYRAKPGDAGPWTVTLRPLATVTGRFILPDGKPLAHRSLQLSYVTPTAAGRDDLPGSPSTKTDADGRFRFTDVIGDVDQEIWYEAVRGEQREEHIHVFRVKPGETKDLGTITTKP